MRKRKFSKVSFNKNLIIDVIGASLIVQKAPLLIDMIMPLDPTIKAVAGVGVGYLAGSMLKRPDLANASIALGVVDFVSPFVDSLLGGGSPVVTAPSSSVLQPVKTGGAMPSVVPGDTLGDYFNLNDYITNPSNRLSYNSYAENYSY